MFIDQNYVENQVKGLYEKKLSFLGFQVDQKEEQLRKTTMNVQQMIERHAFIIKDVEEHKKIVEAMKAEQTKYLFGKIKEDRSSKPKEHEELVLELERKNEEIKTLNDQVDSLKLQLDCISQQNVYL